MFEKLARYAPTALMISMLVVLIELIFLGSKILTILGR